MNSLNERIYFGDSYPNSRIVLRQSLKQFKLGSIYRFCSNSAEFNAHDACGDAQALADIFMSSEYGNQLCQQVKITSKQLASIQKKQSEDKIIESESESELNSFLKNDKIAEKMSKLGINSETLKEMCNKFGKEMIVFFCCTKRKQKRLPIVSKNIREILTIIKGLEDCN